MRSGLALYCTSQLLVTTLLTLNPNGATMKPAQTSATPMLPIAIRPFISSDYPDVAEIITLADPEWPMSAAKLEKIDLDFNPKLHRARFVAEGVVNGAVKVIGMVTVNHNDFFIAPGRFDVRVTVHPSYRNQGIGGGLYQTVLDHLVGMELHELRIGLGERQTAGIRFAEQRGFSESWRRIESRLDTSGFDLSPYADLEAELAKIGITITTFDQIADPERRRKIYDLDMLLTQDIPFGDVPTMSGFEQYQKEFFENPEFLPEACFVAIKDGEYIGFTSFDLQSNGVLTIGMTGVRREYRGQGVAKLLKVRGISYAQSQGNLEIRTFNDTPNQAMLGMNKALGFVVREARLVMVKPITG
jgi:mycothiol synthase